MVKKRGQASIEYIVMIGVLLLFLIPAVHYAMTESATRVKASQVDSSLERLYKSAEAMGALGPGAQEVIIITLPSGIENIFIGNYSIYFRVSGFSGTSDVGYQTKGNVSGSIPITPGTYRVLIAHMPDKVINISLKR